MTGVESHAMLGFLLAATIVFEIPLKGEPAPSAVSALAPVVVSASAHTSTLRLTLETGSEVALGDLERVLGVPVDRAGLPLDRHTIFQIDAGQCFFCAEGPLSQRLAARPFVGAWSVVDYAPRGRLRFRIDPKEPVSLDALGLPVEEVILTARYDDVARVDLYWPTGGVRWRASEKEAREAAAQSKKPLLVFPTAGT